MDVIADEEAGFMDLDGRRAPTIRTVAKHAGVSKSLVSLVLQGSEKVSDEKRDRVMASIRDLGYRPNAAARSLSQRRTKAIGVLLNDLRSPWYADAIEGLSAVLHENDMTMLLGDARLDRRADERLVQSFMDMRMDGLVLVGSMPASDAVLEAAKRIPTVVAGSRDIVLPWVDISAQDDHAGARLATQHLIELGHTRIAHITGTFEAVAEIRRESYEQTMRDHGLARYIRVEAAELSEAGGRDAALKLLSPTSRPTAIFAAADVSALGVLDASSELGLSIPDDLSIIGYDNTFLSRLHHISLTTIDISSEDVGRRAAILLLDRIQNPTQESRILLATPSLVVRATTARA